MKNYLLLTVYCWSIAITADVRADDTFFDSIYKDDHDIEISPSDAVQKRHYTNNQELALLVGLFPGNPYATAITLTCGYTLHINQLLAWEIVSATYAWSTANDLENQLVLFPSVTNINLPSLTNVVGFATSRLIFKALYGKQSILNENVVHLEIYAQGGPSVVWASDQTNTNQYTGGADLGLGARIWLNQSTSMRIQFGDLLYVLNRSIKQNIHTELGLSIDLGDYL